MQHFLIPRSRLTLICKLFVTRKIYDAIMPLRKFTVEYSFAFPQAEKA